MKLPENEKAALLRSIAPAVIALQFKEPPANKDGDRKSGLSRDFIAALWVRRYWLSLVKVLESDSGGAGPSGGEERC